jgi:hypothetical protein
MAFARVHFAMWVVTGVKMKLKFMYFKIYIDTKCLDYYGGSEV